MIRLVQISQGSTRRVALVDEPHLRLLDGVTTIYELASRSAESGESLVALVERSLSPDRVNYDAIYRGKSDWRLLPPLDHPLEPARCLVSGTGLTHLGSAKDRNAMHVATADETDSMKMFRWGVEAGRPEAGAVGVAPEWFYKGNGTILRAPGEPLDVPAYAEDGGEEAEVAGLYLIDSAGRPRRIGLALGNEFSDHKFEKRNYLNLAGSKIRSCAIGPELAIEAEFHYVSGQVTIERAGAVLWTKAIASGETEMCHSLANIEHHHFKFETHRRPGDVHVHFFGAHSLSFGAGVQLADGDVMSVSFAGFGRALRNPVRVQPPSTGPITVKPLA